jgi:hypothetical protein
MDTPQACPAIGIDSSPRHADSCAVSGDRPRAHAGRQRVSSGRLMMSHPSETDVRIALRRALARPPVDIAAVLPDIDWHEIANADEGLAFTLLFEELGYAGVATDALDIAIGSTLGVAGRRAPVIWPLHVGNSAEDLGGSGQLVAEGVVLNRRRAAADRVLAPVGDRMCVLAVSSRAASIPGGLEYDTGWVQVRAWGVPVAQLSSWDYVKRRAVLALASELVGLATRISDVVTTAGCLPAPANLATERIAISRAKTLIATAWTDGTPVAAARAAAAARVAHHGCARQAIERYVGLEAADAVCMSRLIRRGLALPTLLGAAGDTSSIRKFLWRNASVRADGWRSALSDRDNPQRATFAGFANRGTPRVESR